MEEIDEWISENVDMIWQIYVELLLEHKDEILKAAAHWEPDCDTKVEEQKDKEDSPALEVQKKEELTFQFFINLEQVVVQQMETYHGWVEISHV